MKLTGRLKQEVDNIDSMDGKKDAIKKAGMMLTDDELEQVSGGSWQEGIGGMVYWVDDGEGDKDNPPGEKILSV